MIKELTINYQYELYLKQASLSEETMTPKQSMQLKHAFFGACAQFITLQKAVMGTLDEEETSAIFDKIAKEINLFFLNQPRK